MLHSAQVPSQKEQYVINAKGIKKLADYIVAIKGGLKINEDHPLLTLVEKDYYYPVSNAAMVRGSLFGDCNTVSINGNKYVGSEEEFPEYLKSNLQLSDELLALLLNSRNSRWQGYGYHQGLASVFYNAILCSLVSGVDYLIRKKLHLDLYYNPSNKHVFFDATYSGICIKSTINLNSPDCLQDFILPDLDSSDKLTARFIFTYKGFRFQELFSTNRSLLRLCFGFHDLNQEKIFQADAQSKKKMVTGERTLYALRQFNPESIDKLTIDQVFTHNVRLRDDTGRLPWLDSSFMLPAISLLSWAMGRSPQVKKTTMPTVLLSSSPKIDRLPKTSLLQPQPFYFSGSPMVSHPLRDTTRQMGNNFLPSPPPLCVSPVSLRRPLGLIDDVPLNNLQQSKVKTSPLFLDVSPKAQSSGLVDRLETSSPLFPQSLSVPTSPCFNAVATPSASKARSVFSFNAIVSPSQSRRITFPQFSSMWGKQQADKVQRNMSNSHSVLDNKSGC